MKLSEVIFSIQKDSDKQRGDIQSRLAANVKAEYKIIKNKERIELLKDLIERRPNLDFINEHSANCLDDSFKPSEVAFRDGNHPNSIIARLYELDKKSNIRIYKNVEYDITTCKDDWQYGSRTNRTILILNYSILEEKYNYMLEKYIMRCEERIRSSIINESKGGVFALSPESYNYDKWNSLVKTLTNFK